MLGIRILPVLLLALVAAAPAAHAQSTEPVAAFDPPMLPEGLAVDDSGTIYVGIATSGEIRRVTPDGAQSKLAQLRPGIGSLLGLAMTPDGALVAALNSKNTPGSDQQGIWRVALDGEVSLMAALPAVTMPNGLAYAPDGALFVS